MCNYVNNFGNAKITQGTADGSAFLFQVEIQGFQQFYFDKQASPFDK